MWCKIAVHFMAQKETKRETGRDKYPHVPNPSDLLPQAKSYLLRFPELPKIATPAGTKCSKHEPMEHILYSNYNNLKRKTI
jgi:hypothetical protein